MNQIVFDYGLDTALNGFIVHACSSFDLVHLSGEKIILDLLAPEYSVDSFAVVSAILSRISDALHVGSFDFSEAEVLECDIFKCVRSIVVELMACCRYSYSYPHLRLIDQSSPLHVCDWISRLNIAAQSNLRPGSGCAPVEYRVDRAACCESASTMYTVTCRYLNFVGVGSDCAKATAKQKAAYSVCCQSGLTDSELASSKERAVAADVLLPLSSLYRHPRSVIYWVFKLLPLVRFGDYGGFSFVDGVTLMIIGSFMDERRQREVGQTCVSLMGSLRRDLSITGSRRSVHGPSRDVIAEWFRVTPDLRSVPSRLVFMSHDVSGFDLPLSYYDGRLVRPSFACTVRAGERSRGVSVEMWNVTFGGQLCSFLSQPMSRHNFQVSVRALMIMRGYSDGVSTFVPKSPTFKMFDRIIKCGCAYQVVPCRLCLMRVRTRSNGGFATTAVSYVSAHSSRLYLRDAVPRDANLDHPVFTRSDIVNYELFTPDVTPLRSAFRMCGRNAGSEQVPCQCAYADVQLSGSVAHFCLREEDDYMNAAAEEWYETWSDIYGLEESDHDGLWNDDHLAGSESEHGERKLD